MFHVNKFICQFSKLLYINFILKPLGVFLFDYFVLNGRPDLGTHELGLY